ncbi:MAG: CPBP family intramembrane metalloprotease [Bacteroidia bacterium]|nr:CPBP family intramembrane metalloprotease [Bacteroidia bacterium]
MLVAVVVPFYEEVIFRGIVLSALERQLPFMFANILQSGTFAILHEDWKMLPFFFTFGMVAGYFRKRTNNLSIGIVMHMVNNAIAFIATTALH